MRRKKLVWRVNEHANGGLPGQVLSKRCNQSYISHAEMEIGSTKVPGTKGNTSSLQAGTSTSAVDTEWTLYLRARHVVVEK